MTQKQIQRPKKALTSGRIIGGEVVVGEIVTQPKTPSDKIHDAFDPTPPFRFDAKPWNKSRRNYDAAVEAILLKIDIARHQLGCDAQVRRDTRIARWAIAAEPTSAYPVLTQD